MGNEDGALGSRYDVTSKERYVDSTSQKTELDRIIGELARISLETLSWDILKVTKKHFGNDEETNARKLEAYLGGFIVNAASVLHDKGLVDVAYKKLEEAKKILEVKQKLVQEAEAIRLKAEEDRIDVSDILGLFEDEDDY